MTQKASTIEKMTPAELRAAGSLALIFFLRMMGLFLLLPVFTLQATSLRGATHTLVGVAIGCYGLSQAIFQIPFGMLSDRFGRKKIITLGLIIFAIGSAVAAMSHSIYGVMLGRLLQGAGAISSAVMALAADLTREEQRTKTMAIIGISIGLSFSIAFIMGPVVDHWAGLSGVFWAGTLMAAAAIAVLYLRVPNPTHSGFHREVEAVPGQFGSVLRNPELLRLNAGIFCLHFILTASFYAIPLALRDVAGLPKAHHWYVYLPTLLLSILLIMPFLRRGDTQGSARKRFLGAVGLLVIAQVALIFGHNKLWELYISMTLFFTAFNFLEANLPALISRTAPADRKGTALGVYSTCQFMGAFAGGITAGWLFGLYSYDGVFAASIVLAVLWLLIARGMREPESVVAAMMHVANPDPALAEVLQTKLRAMPGVREAVVIAGEGTAYLKFNPKEADREALQALCQSPA